MSYPIQLPLHGKPVLVVGGGAVAARKIRGLLEAGAEVTAVAPEPNEEVLQLAGRSRIVLHHRPFERSDIRNAFLIFAATDDEAVNRAVSSAAREAGILVNVADRPELCTFTLPAVCRRGDLTLTASTDGKCPALSSLIREDLESSFGEAYAPLVAFMGRLRREMIRRGWPYGRVREALAGLYRGGLGTHLAAGDAEGLDAFLRERLGDGWAADQLNP